MFHIYTSACFSEHSDHFMGFFLKENLLPALSLLLLNLWFPSVHFGLFYLTFVLDQLLKYPASFAWPFMSEVYFWADCNLCVLWGECLVGFTGAWLGRDLTTSLGSISISVFPRGVSVLLSCHNGVSLAADVWRAGLRKRLRVERFPGCIYRPFPYPLTMGTYWRDLDNHL